MESALGDSSSSSVMRSSGSGGDDEGSRRRADVMDESSGVVSGEVKRRRTAEADAAALDGLTDQLQSVSLAISAAMDDAAADPFSSEASGTAAGMAELRKWYQTDVFPAQDAAQQRWEERRWAFLGRLQHALKKPLDHTVFPYRIDSLEEDEGSSNLVTTGPPASTFGGLLFVGRSRYNDIVVGDETVSRVHCVIVRSSGLVGVFDGWSSYGTITLRRSRNDLPKLDSALDDRWPLLFDSSESFTLRIGKSAVVTFPGSTTLPAAQLPSATAPLPGVGPLIADPPLAPQQADRVVVDDDDDDVVVDDDDDDDAL